jgi:ABC-type Fe3+-hydroxamate transport system substrate-binding protein
LHDNLFAMPAFTDQLGQTLHLSRTPARIVSLVPSQTELLYTLGADVVGLTKFCRHPDAWFHEKTRVGGTKDIDTNAVAALRPDLIIANKEENDRAQVEALAAHYPVWVSDIHNLAEALAMIRAVGELVGQTQKAQALAAGIEKGFFDLNMPSRSLRTAYLIWKNPKPLTFMAAGGDTFIHDMLRRCGLVNLFAERHRYPTIAPNSLAACDLILLSSEPYPFREKHVRELTSLVPHAAVLLADGEMFSWYGSRLLQAPAYFRRLLTELL